MMHESAQKFVKIIAKIPMFQGLLPAQVLEILKSVEPKVFAPKQIVCEHGSKSTEMYILLAGQLVVRSRDGMPLATIDPIVSVGEMGIITGHPRSATVIAVKQSNTLMLSKMKFDVLLKKAPDVGLTIFKNVIGTLTDRISENNKQIASYQRQLESLKLQFGASDTSDASEQEEVVSEQEEVASEQGAIVRVPAPPIRAGNAQQEEVASEQEAVVPENGSADGEGEGAEEQPQQAQA